MVPRLSNQKPLGAHVVMFDGTNKAPMGRYLADRLGRPAVDVGPVQMQPKPNWVNPLGRNRTFDGPEAA